LAADIERLKSCCARFYEEAPLLQWICGSVLHPGGLRSTERFGRWLRLGRGERVLDVACGPGQAAVHLAATFGCRVTGVDYSVGSAREARRRAGGAIQVLAGDAERLPFREGHFDAVVIECSLCLVPRKAVAVAAMQRVLKPGGRIGVADLALERPLPAEIRDLGAWVACLGGADSVEGYRRLLSQAGFADVATQDATWALTDAINQAGRLLLLADVARGFGALSGLPFTPAQLRGWLDEARRWIAAGHARYIFVSGRRADPESGDGVT
jgi:SAM-dependent methyltransferase